LLPEGGPADVPVAAALLADLPLLFPRGVPIFVDMAEGEGRLADTLADAPALGGTTIVVDG
jgi:hypothetical protein